jgi:hypothetical protein
MEDDNNTKMKQIAIANSRHGIDGADLEAIRAQITEEVRSKSQPPPVEKTPQAGDQIKDGNGSKSG